MRPDSEGRVTVPTEKLSRRKVPRGDRVIKRLCWKEPGRGKCGGTAARNPGGTPRSATRRQAGGGGRTGSWRSSGWAGPCCRARGCITVTGTARTMRPITCWCCPVSATTRTSISSCAASSGECRVCFRSTLGKRGAGRPVASSMACWPSPLGTLPGLHPYRPRRLDPVRRFIPGCFPGMKKRQTSKTGGAGEALPNAANFLAQGPAHQGARRSGATLRASTGVNRSASARRRRCPRRSPGARAWTRRKSARPGCATDLPPRGSSRRRRVCPTCFEGMKKMAQFFRPHPRALWRLSGSHVLGSLRPYVSLEPGAEIWYFNREGCSLHQKRESPKGSFHFTANVYKNVAGLGSCSVHVAIPAVQVFGSLC